LRRQQRLLGSSLDSSLGERLLVAAHGDEEH
jgi:hypothetical protein